MAKQGDLFPGRQLLSSRHAINALSATRHGGYAHFPGTGPRAESCATCAFHNRIERRCSKAFELATVGLFSADGIKADAQRRAIRKRLGRIRGASPACKFWQVTPKP
jgi:hypothetical protein